jgi:cytochrome c556
MIRAFLAGALAVGLVTASAAQQSNPTGAVAQGDPIAARKALMKENGAATALGAKYVKGEEPFDLAKARGILDVYARTAANAPADFPDTAKTGGQTTAAPAIWEKKDDFNGRFAAWGRDVEKAKAEVKDLDTFKAAFPTLTRSCGGCHQLYRQRT